MAKGEQKGNREVQETQEGEDQDNCCGAKPKDRRMAADLRFWQKEVKTNASI